MYGFQYSVYNVKLRPGLWHRTDDIGNKSKRRFVMAVEKTLSQANAEQNNFEALRTYHNRLKELYRQVDVALNKPNAGTRLSQVNKGLQDLVDHNVSAGPLGNRALAFKVREQVLKQKEQIIQPRLSCPMGLVTANATSFLFGDQTIASLLPQVNSLFEAGYEMPYQANWATSDKNVLHLRTSEWLVVYPESEEEFVDQFLPLLNLTFQEQDNICLKGGSKAATIEEILDFFLTLGIQEKIMFKRNFQDVLRTIFLLSLTPPTENLIIRGRNTYSNHSYLAVTINAKGQLAIMKTSKQPTPYCGAFFFERIKL
jgi:hypothetical protein